MASKKLTCYRSGCGKEYFEDENQDGVCLYHPGGPVFHEGLKGWSCCQKRVIDFDEFMKIHGCATGIHSNEKPAQPQSFASTKANADVNLVSTGDVEVYSTSTNLQKAEPKTERPAAPKEKEEKIKEEELNDPEDLAVSIGSVCKRPSCGHKYDGDRDAQCTFHSGEPIFHEGSKGWSCCSRKVLEFDEFLKIKGCKNGKHRYADPPKKAQSVIQCRHDWYQTQTSVILSVFAKNVDKEKSKITFEPFKVIIDIVLANGDVFQKEFILFEEINPQQSKFSILSVKVELNLKKANGLSWAALETTEKVTQWTTFGVQGRVGTIGGKQIVYNSDAPILGSN